MSCSSLIYHDNRKFNLTSKRIVKENARGLLINTENRYNFNENN